MRDGGGRLSGMDVKRAVAMISEAVDPALRGIDAADQAAVDDRLMELDFDLGNRGQHLPVRFQSLGGNTAVAVSLATAWAAAMASSQPLWRLLDPTAKVIPMPQVQIFGGGAHANGRIDVQDLLVIPLGAPSLAEALDYSASIYEAAGKLLEIGDRRFGVADEGGWWPAFDGNRDALEALVRAIEMAGLTPGEDVAIAIDVAASQFGMAGSYRLSRDSVTLDTDGLCELIQDWVERYPIISVEDPVAEDDHYGMTALTKAIGSRVQIIGDDYLVTDATRIEAAAAAGAANAVLIKPNQSGTLTASLQALRAAREHSYAPILSARSGETEDVSVAHLAVGWGAGQIKVGSIARGERTAKWNELLRIEESIGSEAVLAAFEPLMSRRGA